MNNDREWHELEYKKGRRKTYVHVGLDPLEIWIEMKVLPSTALLCAMQDATPLMECKVGEKERTKSIFVNIEWAINEWGGDKEYVDSLKKCRENITKKFSEYQELKPPTSK